MKNLFINNQNLDQIKRRLIFRFGTMHEAAMAISVTPSNLYKTISGESFFANTHLKIAKVLGYN